MAFLVCNHYLSTIACLTEFVCCSAYKNKGVQMLLDGVTAYLPSPLDVTNRALDVNKNQAPLELPSSQQVGLWPFFHHLVTLALWTRLIQD